MPETLDIGIITLARRNCMMHISSMETTLRLETTMSTTTRKLEEMGTPEGTDGLAVAPWSPNEIYAVAADWAEASAPVYSYGDDGWTNTGRQVAYYRHSASAALRYEIEEAIRQSAYEVDDGDEDEDEEVDSIMDEAVEIPWDAGDDESPASLPTTQHQTHDCGGTILYGGSGEQAHLYCSDCGAYTHDTEADELPHGTDREANGAAWDDGDDESPEYT